MNQNPAPIAQTSPHSVYQAHQAEIDQAIRRVLDSGYYILGPEVSAFEAEFADFVGAAHAIGVANGTDALVLALRACGVGPGSLVFTVSHTAVATVAAVEIVGATPVLVDIDPIHFTMDPNHLETLVQRHLQDGHAPSAVVPVHLYGQPVDLPAIMDIAQRYDLYVVEDCAQAHGAALNGKTVGTWGDIAAFSFYPTKNLGALGDGGAVVTNNKELAEKVHLLRQYGWKERYISAIAGMNSRLDELQAAILRVNLRYLGQENAMRQELAKRYRQGIQTSHVTLPVERPQTCHVYHQFVVQISQRDQLRSHLAEHQIGTGIHYPVPVHLQTAYLGRLGAAGDLPHTENAANHILSLPMFPYLQEEQVQRTVDAINVWSP